MSDLARLKKKHKLKTWTDDLDGETYHFREMSEREKSDLSLVGVRINPATDKVEFNGSLGVIREKKLRRIAYQWIDSTSGENLVSPDDCDAELGSLPDDVVDWLHTACLPDDEAADVKDEEEAVKNSD